MLADMMGAMGGAVGGNGGSFAQKRPMMQQNPGMKMGSMMRPPQRPQLSTGGGGGIMQRPQLGRFAQQMGQMGQMQQNQSPEYKDWMMRRPPVGFAPLQGEAKQRWDENYRNWQSQMPAGGGGGNISDQIWRMRNGMGGGIGPRIGGTPPFMPPAQRMPPVPGQPTTGPTYDDAVRAGNGGIAGGMNKGGGLREMLQQILGGRQGGGGAMTQGGPADDPRWTNGTWGTGPARQRQPIAPMMDMMGPQQRIVRNPVMEEEMQAMY